MPRAVLLVSQDSTLANPTEKFVCLDMQIHTSHTGLRQEHEAGLLQARGQKMEGGEPAAVESPSAAVARPGCR